MANCKDCVHNVICDGKDQIFKDGDGNCCLEYLKFVRCKDCKFYNLGYCHFYDNGGFDDPVYVKREYDFCSNGEE